MLKKLLIVITLLGNILIPTGNTTAANGINVYLDNFPLQFDVNPKLVSNRTLVPFRKLSESIGITVRWDQAAKTIYATGKNLNVKLVINSKVAVVNGRNVLLDAAPFTENGRTLIPLRFFMETFDAKVNWNQQTREIRIISQQREMYSFSFYALGSFNHRQYIQNFHGLAYGWSAIDRNGELIIERRDRNGRLNDYFWPEDHPAASTADIIYSGQEVGGEAFLMVAALEYQIIDALVHNPTKVKQVIADIVNTTKINRLDGIFIDFEGIRNTANHAATKRAFTAFMEQLSLEAKKNGLKLSIALVPPNNAFSGYEYRKLATIVDFVFLMAYDYHPREANNARAHMRPEPLSKVNEGIELALKEIPKEKLVLGVNLVHETTTSIPNVIGLAKRHNLKGVGFWLLNQLTTEKITVINRSVKLK